MNTNYRKQAFGVVSMMICSTNKYPADLFIGAVY